MPAAAAAPASMAPLASGHFLIITILYLETALHPGSVVCSQTTTYDASHAKQYVQPCKKASGMGKRDAAASLRMHATGAEAKLGCGAC